MRNPWNRRISGAAMMYAIFVMTTITMICTLIVGLNSYRHFQNKRIYFRHICEGNVQNGLSLMMSEPESFKYDQSITFSLFEFKNDVVTLKREQWGIYDLLTGESHINTDTIERSVLCGNFRQNTNDPVLILAPSIKTLRVGGCTSIKGKSQVPGGYITGATIDGIPFSGMRPDNQFLQQSISFPTPNEEWENKIYLDAIIEKLTRGPAIHTIHNIPDSIFADFNDNPMVCILHGNVVLDRIDVQGKVAIVCDGELIIGANAKFEDALIIGNSVRVQRGFKGAVQIMARDSISVENNCHFYQPSALVICHKNAEKKSSKIIIEDQTIFEGTIICWSEQPCIRHRFFIDLRPGSLVRGQVICNDAVQAGGVIEGCLITKKTLYVSSSQIQENVLLNSFIIYKDNEKSSGIDISKKTTNLIPVKWLN